MSETNKSYRIRTDIGQKKSNEFISIDASLVQDYETFDILSVKIDSTNTYKLHNANYGVIVGRVLANNGFGIPNAKISLFIQSDSEDGRKLRELYPYTSTASKNSDGVRYNLLPDEKINDCHAIAGTFPNKRYALDNDVILEVFEKYYKYTTRTNNAGDYLLMGVPVGSHTLHMDLDLSDCGILSQRPRDFVYKGYTIEQFENPNMFKNVEDNNINSLSQIFTQDRPINVQPFWGNSSLGEKIGITRADIDVAFKFEPTCVFIGSVVSDNSSQGITKKCMATENMGYMEEMTTGEGTIEMIRKTPSGDIEEFQIRGTQLIDGNGVWCYQIPMNLDYMMTDEYGNMVPTDDPEKGIPTRTQVRFRMSMQDNEENTDNFFRAKVLVPHNPQILSNGTYEEYDYSFGSMTRDDSFRDLFWNNVYSVKSYIPRFQKRKIQGWKDKKFTGFKSCNFYGSNNPMPYNNIRIKLPFMFTIICAIVKIFIAVVAFINTCISVLGNVCADIGDTWIFGYPFKKLYKYALKLTMIVLREGLCPDLENWYFSPMSKNNLWVPEKRPPRNWTKYDLLTQTMEKIYESEYIDDSTSIDTQNNEESEYEEPICLTVYTDYLISCIEMNLAMEYKVINFDFYNDWVNGVLYFPRFMRYLRPKITFLGITFARAKIKGCMDDTKIFSKTRRYTQQCSIGFKSSNSNNADTFTSIDSSFLGVKTKKKLKAINNYHKKRGFTQKTIFGKKGGICHEVTTTKGHHVYYLKPCEWLTGTIPENKKVNLFATDIILLGSLNDCDQNGVPQAFKYLSSTSYVLPTNLALTNMDTNGNLYATVKGTICAGKSFLSYDDILNATSGVTVIPPSSGLSGEILYYSGAQESNYDVQYDGVELSDIIALTESAGIAWNYTGPGQGTPDNSRLYNPGGHFLGMSCTNSETNIKSCINLSRICEVGVNMSQRKEDIFEISNKGEVRYKYTTPSGFISGDDIVGADFRTMFATLNKQRLIATKINPITGYKMYDFEYVNPINFSGEFKSVVDDKKHLYNQKIQIPVERFDVLRNVGIDTNPSHREDYDMYEENNTQTRTIEDNSADYYSFRFGLNYDELKKNNQKHLRKFLVTDGRYYYLPQFENSYYFYFGLKNGATAIDEFNKQFFSQCENGMLLGNEPNINIGVVDDINICEANADIIVTSINLETPYQYIEVRTNTSDGVLRVDNSNDDEGWLTSYSFIMPSMPFGEYTVTIRDVNGIEVTKSNVIGKNIIEYSANIVNFHYNPKESALNNKNLGSELHKGGYIELFEFRIPKLEDDTPLTFLVYKDVENTDNDTFINSAETKNNVTETVKISVKESGEYNLYVQYKCETESAKSQKILMQSFTIKDGSSIGLSIGMVGIEDKPLTVETHGAKTKWWENMGNSNEQYWLERLCLFNEINDETLGSDTMSARIYPTNEAIKCVWGVGQNRDGIFKGPNGYELFCSEDYLNIQEGYIVDDETIFFPTYAYHKDSLQSPTVLPNYSILAYKGNDVMGNYYAYLDNSSIKGITLTHFVENNGYIFKPLPDGDLQFHIYKTSEGLQYDDKGGEITNGLFYPSVSIPIPDRPFYAIANYYVWQERHLGTNVDDISGEEKAAVIDYELTGRVEMDIHNGVTYKGKFGNTSFVDNADISKITVNNDMNGANNSIDRITKIRSFYNNSIDAAISGITSYVYNIFGGYPSDKTAYTQMVNSISNDTSTDFPEYIKYDYLRNVSFNKETDMVVDWFLCKQPYNEISDYMIVKEDGPLYEKYDKRRYHFACTYTDKAYYNIEGATVIANVKDPWLGKTVISFPMINEDGATVTVKRKFKNKNANSVEEYFERINDGIPELMPCKKYRISNPTGDKKWCDIFEKHRITNNENIDEETGILYGVAVIAKEKRADHYYGNEDMAVYKIYTDPVKVLQIKDMIATEISVTPSELTVDHSDGEYVIEVKNDGATEPWFATTMSDWITISPSTYVGTNENVKVIIKRNIENGDREGVVKFSSNSTDPNDYAELTVIQTMAIENSEVVDVVNSSPFDVVFNLDETSENDDYYDKENDIFRGEQILCDFNIESDKTEVSVYPPKVKVNYSFYSQIDGSINEEISEDLKKQIDFNIIMTIIDLSSNSPIIDKSIVIDNSGSDYTFNSPLKFNPTVSTTRNFSLVLKWEIKCMASQELKNGVKMKIIIDPADTFDISKK